MTGGLSFLERDLFRMDISNTEGLQNGRTIATKMDNTRPWVNKQIEPSKQCHTLVNTCFYPLNLLFKCSTQYVSSNSPHRLDTVQQYC